MSSLTQTQQKALLFASAAALRLLLAAAFPTLPPLLTGRVELSTPVNSFKRLQEGLFLYDNGLSPYDGGLFHQAPLLLPLFSLLPDPATYPLFTILLYTILDLAAAQALIDIAQSAQASLSRFYSSPRKHLALAPIYVAAAYLFNPFTLLTCLARPTSVLGNLFTLLAISKACAGAPITSAFSLALASYVSLHPLLLAPPLTILCYDVVSARSTAQSSDETPAKQTQSPSAAQRSLAAFATRQTITLALFIALLFVLSFVLTGQSWSFLASVYGTRLLLPDLTPNVGLWWYFFIEMFDSFRAFFLAVFWLHMAAYSPALTIRLRRQPLAAVMLLIGVFAIFQPYANVGDAGLWLSALTVFAHLADLSRYPFPALSALLYTTFLAPAFYYLWIYAGSGNANFFYAITLVWSLALSVLLGDFLYAVLRDEWELERPEMKGRRDVARI
ncbi:hypothetical protein AAFC00_002174 [Neodothiora populina]|uniref:GPI transamidase subunit PIG-U n=1 Tax=Neodothiora populina TaxID=2781224 RepID=A0ABR3PGI0_9PEZI